MLTQRSDLIGETDFHRMKRIGNILRHFRYGNCGFEYCSWQAFIKFSQRRQMFCGCIAADEVMHWTALESVLGTALPTKALSFGA